MRVVGLISCCAIQRSRSAPTVDRPADVEGVSLGLEAREDLLGLLVRLAHGTLLRGLGAGRRDRMISPRKDLALTVRAGQSWG